MNHMKINYFHIRTQMDRKAIQQLIRATKALYFRNISGLRSQPTSPVD